MTTTHLGGITGNGVMNSLKFVDLGCGAGSCLASALLLSQSQDTNIDNKNESSHSLSPPPRLPGSLLLLVSTIFLILKMAIVVISVYSYEYSDKF
jgi:hypothetical protein